MKKPERPNFPPRLRIPRDMKHPSVEPGSTVWEIRTKKETRMIQNPSGKRTR